MIDRNELLAQATDRAVMKGILRPSAATDLVLLYRNECVVAPDQDTVLLHNKPLDEAVAELIKARPHWQPDKSSKPTDRVSIETERAALLAAHKDWGASEKSPVEPDKKSTATPLSKNPWGPNWNLTRQMQLFKADPKAAAEIAASVGCRIGDTHPNPNYASGDRHVDANRGAFHKRYYANGLALRRLRSSMVTIC